MKKISAPRVLSTIAVIIVVIIAAMFSVTATLALAAGVVWWVNYPTTSRKISSLRVGSRPTGSNSVLRSTLWTLGGLVAGLVVGALALLGVGLIPAHFASVTAVKVVAWIVFSIVTVIGTLAGFEHGRKP